MLTFTKIKINYLIGVEYMNKLRIMPIILLAIGIGAICLGFLSMSLYNPIGSCDAHSSYNSSKAFTLNNGTRYTITVVRSDRVVGDISGTLQIIYLEGEQVLQLSVYDSFNGGAEYSTSFKNSFRVNFTGNYYMRFYPSSYTSYSVNNYYKGAKIVIQEGAIENMLNINMRMLFIIGGFLVFVGIISAIITIISKSTTENYCYDDSYEPYEESEKIKTIYCSNCGRKADGAYCDSCSTAIEE